MTKLTWDNAVLIGPGDGASAWSIETEDLVELELNGKKIKARSGFRPAIPIIPSLFFWVTDARAPAASAPARASTCTAAHQRRRLGSPAA